MKQVSRYRINPIEIVIFSAISIAFLNSLYTLLYRYPTLKPAALKPMSANAQSSLAQNKDSNRAPASVSQSFVSLEVTCDPQAERSTHASRVRVIGSLCDQVSVGTKPLKASVLNTKNNYSATLFIDTHEGKFSTDYIPLELGLNELQIEFTYTQDKNFKQKLVLNRQ